ncbi:MAG TPA: hypothetical protein VIL98_15585 [Gaiellaceae bacterium]
MKTSGRWAGGTNEGDRIVGCGVLDRFSDKDLPKVVEEAEALSY